MKLKSKKQFLDQFDKLKDNKLDLSSDEDLSIAVMNLISIEEHFFFTGQKTGNSDYYKMLEQIREMRKDLLKKLIKQYEGEVWCISKHLLAASMRLMEVGTKHLTRQEYPEAEAMFDKAYDLYTLFWGLNMNQVDLSGVKAIDDDKLSKTEQLATTKPKKTAKTEVVAPERAGIFGKTRDLVKRLVDCCIE